MMFESYWLHGVMLAILLVLLVLWRIGMKQRRLEPVTTILRGLVVIIGIIAVLGILAVQGCVGWR